MTLHDKLNIRLASWVKDYTAIRDVRDTVFVVEQSVPVDLEIDGKDEECTHVLAFVEDRVVGTARMQTDGHIGRVAVRKEWRSRGFGTCLMNELIEIARRSGMEQVYLNSQTQAERFYKNLGFKAEGPIFIEADMPHVKMVRRFR